MTTSLFRFTALVVAAALGFLPESPVVAAAAAKPVTHTVSIDGARFQPDIVIVKAGDSVVWVNKDPYPHTVTSSAGGFDSHEIAAGKSWKLRSARKGEFAYACTLHPTMTATLRVK
jgi:plastocyanin